MLLTQEQQGVKIKSATQIGKCQWSDIDVPAIYFDLGYKGGILISGSAASMARHIAFLGERPVFYWGQPYLGSLEAFTAAPLFRLFDSSTSLLKLVPAKPTDVTGGMPASALPNWFDL